MHRGLSLYVCHALTHKHIEKCSMNESYIFFCKLFHLKAEKLNHLQELPFVQWMGHTMFVLCMSLASGIKFDTLMPVLNWMM